MIKRILPFLLIILLPLGGYLYYRQMDGPQINRQLDKFIGSLEYSPISTQSAEAIRKNIANVMADSVSFHGEPPVPTEPLTQKQVIEQIAGLHGMIRNCEFTEIERTVRIDGDTANVLMIQEIEVAAGGSYKATETWKIMVDLKKTDRWRITGIKGEPPANSITRTFSF